MRKKENIETIYRAALTVFSQYGFRKSTLEDIASQLGMTKSNLYLYAKNKKDLYRNTVAWALTRWQNRVREAVENESDPLDQFTVMCFKAVEYLSKDDEFRQVLIHDPDIFPMFPVKDPFEEINARSVAMIRAILVAGIEQKRFRPVDPDKVSAVVFSIYKMFIIRTYIKADGDAMREAFVEAFDLLTQGLFIEGRPSTIKRGG